MTTDLLQQIANERLRQSQPVSTRLDETTLEILERYAETHGMRLSALLRVAAERLIQDLDTLGTEEPVKRRPSRDH